MEEALFVSFFSLFFLFRRNEEGVSRLKCDNMRQIFSPKLPLDACE